MKEKLSVPFLLTLLSGVASSKSGESVANITCGNLSLKEKIETILTGLEAKEYYDIEVNSNVLSISVKKDKQKSENIGSIQRLSGTLKAFYIQGEANKEQIYIDELCRCAGKKENKEKDGGDDNNCQGVMDLFKTIINGSELMRNLVKTVVNGCDEYNEYLDLCEKEEAYNNLTGSLKSILNSLINDYTGSNFIKNSSRSRKCQEMLDQFKNVREESIEKEKKLIEEKNKENKGSKNIFSGLFKGIANLDIGDLINKFFGKKQERPPVPEGGNYFKMPQSDAPYTPSTPEGGYSTQVSGKLKGFHTRFAGKMPGYKAIQDFLTANPGVRAAISNRGSLY